jgi:hypothetical protein
VQKPRSARQSTDRLGSPPLELAFDGFMRASTRLQVVLLLAGGTTLLVWLSNALSKA